MCSSVLNAAGPVHVGRLGKHLGCQAGPWPGRQAQAAPRRSRHSILQGRKWRCRAPHSQQWRAGWGRSSSAGRLASASNGTPLSGCPNLVQPQTSARCTRPLPVGPGSFLSFPEAIAPAQAAHGLFPRPTAQCPGTSSGPEASLRPAQFLFQAPALPEQPSSFLLFLP